MIAQIPFIAAAFSLVLAFASVLRKKPTPATWCFFAGMLLLALDSVITGLTLRIGSPEDLVSWLIAGLFAESALPVVWLGFSLTYSRGDYREALRRWRVPLVVIGLLPPVLSLWFRDGLFQVVRDTSGELLLRSSQVTVMLNVNLLVAFVLVLMNVEQTFRAAVGTARWRIKFVVLGLGVIFGTRIYVRAQSMLFSAPDLTQWSIESGGLLIGCVFLAVGYARTRLVEIDVYPSLAVLRSSFIVLLVGGYLFIVGVLAQVVRRFGNAESFQLQAFVVLLGMSGLALLLLSDRARQRVHVFTVRHFKKAQHDSVQVWTLFSQRLASVKNEAQLSEASAKLISETFDVLSVTAWLHDEEVGRLEMLATTAPRSGLDADATVADTGAVIAALKTRSAPFDLEDVNASWAEELRRLNPTTFLKGGNRWCIPLRTADRTIGLLVLSDRVSGAPYTVEELELLKCIGNQITSVLLNLRLAGEIANAREMGAFHTMSSFFVHDLKNTAASLNLMLNNLPVHFDDPEFRADALRAIGNTTRRIEDMISRLSAVRQQQPLTRVDTDLSQLIGAVLDTIGLPPDVELSKELQPLPRVAIDREQIKSVVTNLVINAREASERGGRIRVSTEHQHHRVVLAVSDTGCGMAPSFVQERLFRPFQSTKKQGLGIGLFQCRAIVQAHGGSIHIVSEPDKGTTFTVTLPLSADQ